MKNNTLLRITALLSILLLTLHVTDDIVRGISKAEQSDTALVVLAIFLYGTLVLAERRSGHVIMLLMGLFAAAMPALHMRGLHYPEIAKSAGGFFSCGRSGHSEGSGSSHSSYRPKGSGACEGASLGLSHQKRL